jgi:sugar lactone lactonase YvrE
MTCSPRILLISLFVALVAFGVAARDSASVHAAGPPGTIDTVAGNGTYGYSGDGGPATSAELFQSGAVALDVSGNLYIADTYNCRVRKVSGGTITTVAGTGLCTSSGDGGPATSATLDYPSGIVLDQLGNLYVSEVFGCRVRKVISGTIATVAGTGDCTYNGDAGLAASIALYEPHGLAIDASGSLYIADTRNCLVRKVSGGIMTTVAGTSSGGYPVCNFSGDGGPAVSAALQYPYDVTLDAAGDLYIGDTLNCRVRRVIGGVISTVAGTDECSGGSPTWLGFPYGVKLDGLGNIYVADGANCRVREVSGGSINTIAGTGVCNSEAGDGGPAISAAVGAPIGLALDESGNLYIAEQGTRVRAIYAVVDGDQVPDAVDNCPNAANPDQTDSDVDGLGDACETPSGYGTNPSNPDTDGDGCLDGREVRTLTYTHQQGGDRDPLNPNDFFDVPVPALTPSNTTGTRNKAVSIADVIAILTYIGTYDTGPANANAVSYNTDLNANSIPDGREYDRTPSTDPSKPWRSAAPNGAVSIGDALVALNQVGDNCN